VLNNILQLINVKEHQVINVKIKNYMFNVFNIHVFIILQVIVNMEWIAIFHIIYEDKYHDQLQTKIHVKNYISKIIVLLVVNVNFHIILNNILVIIILSLNADLVINNVDMLMINLLMHLLSVSLIWWKDVIKLQMTVQMFMQKKHQLISWPMMDLCDPDYS
jgi:hypothetical protein